jgi:hypothetical protein
MSETVLILWYIPYMSEGIEKKEKEQSKEALIAGNLEKLLKSETRQSFELTEYDGTYEMDADIFSLTFTIEDGIFEIRSIEVRGEKGLGKKIISTIQKLTTEVEYQLVASNVQDTAVGFWQRMGFEQTNIDGEYCWNGEQGE